LPHNSSCLTCSVVTGAEDVSQQASDGQQQEEEDYEDSQVDSDDSSQEDEGAQEDEGGDWGDGLGGDSEEECFGVEGQQQQEGRQQQRGRLRRLQQTGAQQGQDSDDEGYAAAVEQLELVVADDLGQMQEAVEAAYAGRARLQLLLLLFCRAVCEHLACLVRAHAMSIAHMCAFWFQWVISMGEGGNGLCQQVMIC
jgi:hypothetical protein